MSPTLRRLLLATLSLAMPLAVMAGGAAVENSSSKPAPKRYPPTHHDPVTLIEKVRDGTKAFKDINNLGADWGPATPCVSGPNEGAMGIHMVKGMGESLHDGILDAREPELLIYEPLGNGYYRFVGVEFIAFADDWATRDPNHDGKPPRIEGHLMNYVGAPNRYGLPAFYELHVWAWEDNPKGTFADWNTHVTCDKAVEPVS
jgi:hypothetical protein